MCVSKRKMLTDYCTQQFCSDCTVCHSALWFCSYCKDLRPWLVLIAAAIAWTPSSCSRFAVRLTHTHTNTQKYHTVHYQTYQTEIQTIYDDKWLIKKSGWGEVIFGRVYAVSLLKSTINQKIEVTHSRSCRELFFWRALAMFFAPSTPMEFSLKLII